MKIAEITFGIFLLGISILMFILGLTYPYQTQFGPGPGFFPVWVTGIMIVISTIFLFTLLKKNFPEKFFSDSKGKKFFLAYIALFIAGIVLIDILGMMVSFALFSLLVYKFMEKYNWKRSVSVSIGTMVILFLIFKVWLKVPTPSGLLFL
ncbi:tripartite tricarboxylate transporter TctB family protein [Bacillus sp. ISL-47]|uniref:tripartite tricarboxylate transporter TctB family protein n=1 Tax=Bacillus sp. ISL-47 TaxID=2819130 RepID=UPI001BE72EDD|nr:tripartite tricarboxylate transporter TctB family protein [Bacillus sp. ISL-47]MBT2689250.1 tripartite tricarboxylate transporter TctB family protein [Bacillus sp. ISL-47]MBT2708625.1 tripartite tricarboxylate transporter TctB family protein [Pseudomonas sp. ISL-84]